MGATPFPWFLRFTLDTYLLMLSVKQGGIKYHFFESLVWRDVGLPPGLPDYWRTLYLFGQWPGYIYIYIYVCVCVCVVPSISFQNFFVQAFKIVGDSWKFTMLLPYILWLTNFYDFSFKWIASTGIGIHPTKVWLSQLVNFKNTIWTWGHFRRTICNKILF